MRTYCIAQASLVAQLVKNPPAVRETWVRSLGWEDPLEKERLPAPVFCPGEFYGRTVHRVTKGWTWLSDFHFTSLHSTGKKRRHKNKKYRYVLKSQYLVGEALTIPVSFSYFQA